MAFASARGYAGRFIAGYRRAFRIEEIEQSRVLQWMFGAMLFFFFLTFSQWMASQKITIETAKAGTAVCWPYFQKCYELYFLHNLPYGYTQTELYMVLYGIMLLIVYFMAERKWTQAHLLMLPLFFWKIFVGFVLSYDIQGPYDYYHLILTTVLLFAPFKEYFLKLSFVLMYFVSATIKLDPAWTLGTYFTTLKTGLPLFPTALTSLFTNFVIFMQVVGAWFLLSSRRLLQRTALVLFAFFHLYSGILVLYHYPSIALPPLLILFGPWYAPTPIPVRRRALIGWAMMAVIIAFQLPGFFIPAPGDRRLTLEGNRYGMFMFESNHQCVSTITTYRTGVPLPAQKTSIDYGLSKCGGFYCLTNETQYAQDGLAVTQDRYESVSSWNRCDPYELWAKYHLTCSANPSVTRVAWTFDHSINGGPFYRIVDTPNVCALSYNTFSHNDWIAVPPEASVVGYPTQNEFRYP